MEKGSAGVGQVDGATGICCHGGVGARDGTRVGSSVVVVTLFRC